MKFRVALFALSILFITSCTNGDDSSVERTIGKIAENCSSKEECQIAAKELVKFKWDKMYAFSYPVSLETINQAVGTQYSHYKEFTRSIIFTENGNIVYYENNPANIEGLIDKQVVFNYPDSVKYQVYLPSAKFKIEKKEFEKGYYYDLEQTH